MNTMHAATSASPHVRSAQRYATSLALIATLGPFFYGFEGMVLNGAISAVGTEFELGALAQGVAGAIGILGGFIGALFAGRLSDRIGRRTVLMLVGVCLLFEAVLGAFSPWLGGFGFRLGGRFFRSRNLGFRLHGFGLFGSFFLFHLYHPLFVFIQKRIRDQFIEPLGKTAQASG